MLKTFRLTTWSGMTPNVCLVQVIVGHDTKPTFSSAIVTANGSLQITLSKKENHNLTYTGGMLQSWNQFCFTGGLLEVSVRLPGKNNVAGQFSCESC